jgi:L-arabinonolactonase
MHNPARAMLFVDCRCTLGEGILWYETRRALLWTDIQQSTLWMHGVADNVTRTWTLPDRLGSLAICESGRLLLGLAKGLFLADIDTAAGAVLRVEPVVSVEPGLPRTRINDGRTDRAGNFVFGTFNEAEDGPAGSFYQYSSRHGLRRLDLGGVVIPNSICFSLDGRTMYFCDSPTARIRQCDYDAASAGVTNVREFVRLGAGEGLPDGSVIDTEGCLWNAAWGAGAVRRYAPDGSRLAEISIPAKNATCVVFGGDRLEDLYVTSSRQEMSDDELERTPDAGGVYRVSVGVRGVRDAVFHGA